MCDVAQPIISHLERLLATKSGRQSKIDSEIIDYLHSDCDKLNVHAEVVLAIVPRLYLDMKTRFGEFWLTLHDGLHNLARFTIILLWKTIDQGLRKFDVDISDYFRNRELEEIRKLDRPYNNFTLF